jgi:hypothetical protein
MLFSPHPPVNHKQNVFRGRTMAFHALTGGDSSKFASAFGFKARDKDTFSQKLVTAAWRIYRVWPDVNMTQLTNAAKHFDTARAGLTRAVEIVKAFASVMDLNEADSDGLAAAVTKDIAADQNGNNASTVTFVRSAGAGAGSASPRVDVSGLDGADDADAATQPPTPSASHAAPASFMAEGGDEGGSEDGGLTASLRKGAAAVGAAVGAAAGAFLGRRGSGASVSTHGSATGVPASPSPSGAGSAPAVAASFDILHYATTALTEALKTPPGPAPTETEVFDTIRKWLQTKPTTVPTTFQFETLPLAMYAHALASLDVAHKPTEKLIAAAIVATLKAKTRNQNAPEHMIKFAKHLHILDTLTSILPRAGRVAFLTGIGFTPLEVNAWQPYMSGLATALMRSLTKDATDPSLGMSPLDGRPFDAELDVEKERVTKSVDAFRKSLMERTMTMTSDQQRRHLRDILAATPSLLSAIGSAKLPSVETPAGTPLKTYQSLGYNHNATKAAAPSAVHVDKTTIEGLL